MARPGRTKRVRGDRDVPGVTENPAANLLLADILMRTASYAINEVVQRRMLKNRYDSKTAKQIVKKRSLLKTATSFTVARIATRSIPGAMLVGGGMLVKTLFDRSQSYRAARKDGDDALTGRLDDA